MKPERWQQLDDLFHSALERAPEQRAAFLDEACAGNETLRKQVEALLAAHREAGSFIESPAIEVEARSVADHHNELTAGQTIGRYQIVSQLGVGGMGEVYLAEDATLGRKVALKLLPSEFTHNTDRLHRFQQEARAASALNHPNIVTIHEIGQVDNRHFIATEFIDGQTLRQRLNRAPSHTAESVSGRSGMPPPLHEVLNIAIQTADALSAAHEAGIVHRDIKPENIMVRRRDGYVKVLDFGLAKLTEGAVDNEAPTRAHIKTSAGAVMGTPSYMSPEQARGEQVDARTDIWSLGVVLYELVAGCLPFGRSNPSEVIALILEREPAPLARYAIGVPAELERIVSKALTKDREERYQTAKDLLVDLRRLRQRLEVEAEIERTGQTEKTSEEKTVATGSEQTTATVEAATRETGDRAAAHTSSAAYLVEEIKQHRRGVITILVVLLAATLVGYFAYSRYWSRGGTNIDSGASIRSIAVLPFTNMSNNPDTEYVSDGVSESLINSLSQLPGVKVIARSSSFKYKDKEVDLQEVANTLGVEAILTGRVVQRGDSLVISAELVDARDKTQVWGGQYNPKSADLFVLQGDIAREIADRLRLKLTGAARQQLAKRATGNLKAFQYYMQGQSYAQRRTRENLLTAIHYYEQAIAEDQNYALAYAGVAEAYANLGLRSYIDPVEARRKTEEAGRKAVELDDNLGEAHAAHSLIYSVFAPYNFSLGEREMRRAIELSPNLATAHQNLGLSLMRHGRLDEGIEEILKARELDPLSSIIARQMALPHYLKRDYVQALKLLRQANELGPAFSTIWEIGVYIQNGLFNEALAELEKAQRERKGDPILIYSTGMVYAAQGKRAEALQIIKELEVMSGTNLSQAQYIAKIYAALNEKESALNWLERPVAAGVIGVFYKDEAAWDPIRSDPRFADLLRRIGFTL